jgi:hypothetical protein
MRTYCIHIGAYGAPTVYVICSHTVYIFFAAVGIIEINLTYWTGGVLHHYMRNLLLRNKQKKMHKIDRNIYEQNAI